VLNQSNPKLILSRKTSLEVAPATLLLICRFQFRSAFHSTVFFVFVFLTCTRSQNIFVFRIFTVTLTFDLWPKWIGISVDQTKDSHDRKLWSSRRTWRTDCSIRTTTANLLLFIRPNQTQKKLQLEKKMCLRLKLNHYAFSVAWRKTCVC